MTRARAERRIAGPHGQPVAADRPVPEAGEAPIVIVAPVELDLASAAAFQGSLQAALQTGSAAIVADLGRTTFCDSSGFKVLVQVARLAHAGGRRFEIREPPRMLRRMAEILGAASLLDLAADEPSPTLPTRPSEQGLPSPRD